MLELADHWVWDSWVLDTGEAYHLFFLRASRALLDPDRRHLRASVGHAVSTDLHTWTLLPDALVHADAPAWDDLATWTGSAVLDDTGRCWLFYTGLGHGDRGLVQRVGAAVSDDLVSFERVGTGPLVEADRRWYETLDTIDPAEPGAWPDETWRDPHVLRDPDGDGWHMLVTARAATGPSGGRGVIGHARSHDLRTWEVQPPLTEPSGFPWLEVPQSAVLDGSPVLVFSCWADPAAGGAPGRTGTRGDRAPGAAGGMWTAPGSTLLGPWDLHRARPLTVPSLYAGHLAHRRDGSSVALGFRDGPAGSFVGAVGDPVPVRLAPDGTVVVLDVTV